MAAPNPTSSSTAATRSTPTARSAETVALPDGTIWTQRRRPRRSPRSPRRSPSSAASTLQPARRERPRLQRRGAQVNQWDDHEVLNNWYPGEIVDDARYTEKSVDVLAARARRAFLEYAADRRRRRRPRDRDLPQDLLRAAAGRLRRSTCAPTADRNDANATPTTAPRPPRRRAARVAQAGLARSQATWKVIASDMPLGLVVPDGDDAHEGVAQRRPRRAARPRAGVRRICCAT